MQINLHPTVSIVLVGCGGTGGYLVPKLARLLMTLKQFKRETNFFLTVVDPDTVEEANLYRQNFVRNDLGKNKAHVMAQRYSLHFGINIGSVPERIESPEKLRELFLSLRDDRYSYSQQSCILIGCVDNNSARRVMHDLFKNWNGLGYRHNLYYIDAGNGRYSGQVVTGYREVNKLILPPVGEIFPDAIIEDDEPPRSCIQNALEAPQNIGANDLAATMVFSVLNILLTEEEINSHILTFDGRRQEFLSRTQL